MTINKIGILFNKLVKNAKKKLPQGNQEGGNNKDKAKTNYLVNLTEKLLFFKQPNKKLFNMTHKARDELAFLNFFTVKDKAPEHLTPATLDPLAI